MEFVCNDLDGKSPWHYVPEEDMYYRCFDGGKHQGKVKGEYIPDPNVIWAERIRLTKMALESRGEEFTEGHKKQCRPSNTTFMLWDHWNRD